MTKLKSSRMAHTFRPRSSLYGKPVALERRMALNFASSIGS
jgi:hypothetical protein